MQDANVTKRVRKAIQASFKRWRVIERQERNRRRDGALFLLGLTGMVLVEAVDPFGPIGSGGRAVHGLLFGCSVGILLSGVFRATPRQTLCSTLALGVGFGFGAVIDMF